MNKFKIILLAVLATLGIGTGGYLGGRTAVLKTSAYLTTTEVTTTTLRTFSVPNVTSTAHIVSDILANSTTTSAGWHCIADFKIINSSTISQVGSTVCDANSTGSGWGVGFSTTTGGINLIVNGQTSSTIYWQDKTEFYTL